VYVCVCVCVCVYIYIYILHLSPEDLSLSNDALREYAGDSAAKRAVGWYDRLKRGT